MTSNESYPSFLNRMNQLYSALEHSGFQALVLNPGPSLVYLTGLHFHLSERPVVAIFIPGKDPVLALPELELRKLDHLPFKVQPYPYGEDPLSWSTVFHRAVQAAGVEHARIGVEPNRLRFLELRLLEGAAPQSAFISAEEIIANLRMSKDDGELANMRKAVEIAQKALLATLPIVKAGVTEQHLASELVLQLLRAGSDAEIPFAPIVSGGPNSANPHAVPSDRPLQPGDLLVIDWGASHNGYFSDLTRTFAMGPIEEEFVQISRIVEQANFAGRQACHPGATAGDIDHAARSVIETAGYGPYFTHRTGHGLGMEGHEPPYMRSGNPLILKTGMTFTVEPGIYLPGRNGVRIEDNVVITQEGYESLSDMPRELKFLEP